MASAGIKSPPELVSLSPTSTTDAPVVVVSVTISWLAVVVLATVTTSGVFVSVAGAVVTGPPASSDEKPLSLKVSGGASGASVLGWGELVRRKVLKEVSWPRLNVSARGPLLFAAACWKGWRTLSYEQRKSQYTKPSKILRVCVVHLFQKVDQSHTNYANIRQ